MTENEKQEDVKNEISIVLKRIEKLTAQIKGEKKFFPLPGWLIILFFLEILLQIYYAFPYI
jgi:uncharacterized radical SAM superfamily Fe-S cluster-containing enzyme